jgi:hypothetical protein
MDHLEAKRLHAAEKYVLGELSADQRDSYEEHYFDCAECAEDVKSTLIFVTAGREVFREDPVPASPVPKPIPARPRWTSWFRPVIAFPAMAALLLAVGYYTLSSKPGIGVITSPGQIVVSGPSFGLRGGDRLQNEKTIVPIRGTESFQLRFDFVPAQDHVFSSYTGELQDNSSRVLLQFRIPAERLNKEVQLAVPPGLLHPGDYILAVFGHDAATSPKTQVGKFAFAVQNIP